MEFKDWISKKYTDWRGDTIGNEKSITQFANLLGINRSILTRYMNGTLKSPRLENVVSIAKIYPEIYEILGISRPSLLLSIETFLKLPESEQVAAISAWNEASDDISSKGIDPSSPEANLIRIELFKKRNLDVGD